jgi:Ni2+-binding GTPase involved in maturation of urease and hydrogenase
MIILGHPILNCETFFKIENTSDIKNTTPNSVVLTTYNLETINYCFKNNIPCGVFINSIKEAIFSNNLRAKYLICEDNMGKNIQQIAENYMFDSKVIVVIDDDEGIEKIAKDGIDGVIYKDFLEGLK